MSQPKIKIQAYVWMELEKNTCDIKFTKRKEIDLREPSERNLKKKLPIKKSQQPA